MDNHFHLLLTPQTENGLPQMMQSVGRQYVRYFNRKNQRTGTLWEGRYRSTVVQSERHLFACMVYLDLNPVRAGMVASPELHAWSSHGHYLGRRVDRLVTPHALYWGLGNTPFAREVAYGELVESGLTADLQAQMTQAALQGWAFGDATFVSDLQKRTVRRVEKRSAGRPVSRIHTIPPG
jgi:putative transposase